MPRAPEPLTTTSRLALARVWERTYILVFLALLGLLAFAVVRAGWVAVVRGGGALFGLVGLFAVLWSWRAMRLARDSITWPRVEARITSSRVEKDVTTTHSPSGRLDTAVSCFPTVEYEYEVQGLTYSSSRVLFLNVSYPEDEAEATVARYPAGGTALASVHPRNPWLAVLEPGLRQSSGHYAKGLVVGGVFAVAGAAVWFLVPVLAGL